MPVQIKLLRVLQEGTFSRVGSHDRLRFAGRVIAATNHSLSELRRQRRFRYEFFYCLSSNVVTVPLPRQHIEESPRELAQLVSLTLVRTVGEDNPDLSGDRT